ncbi:endoglucanase 5-like [Phragmites australis]|uniref:endoglucanase 5-like n=1 Tax=Phragmites australis TaxID=29695 RepID=UPI002D78EC8C|nr:endoglucanase 5-like [Phragmites australis]
MSDVSGSFVVAAAVVAVSLAVASAAAHDYGEALHKSLLYFEAQRSGRLPYNQRVRWRGHSGLTDGLEQGVDLVGGYYDAGDHVKFGLPMAFTVTMLSWGVLEYGEGVAAAGELAHALQAIKWGTDYFIKAHTGPNVLWAQVGDGDSDHYCWQRPEDMTTSRRAYKVDAENPGSEVAAETAAAMAAASVVFRRAGDAHYAHLLLHHAQQLFEFADTYRGRYDASVEVVKSYYPSSSGYQDELLWAALWLHRATGRRDYLDYALANADDFGGTGWAVSEFSWDIKYAGLQVLASELLVEEKERQLRLSDEQRAVVEQYRSKAEYYVCSCMNRNPGGAEHNAGRTPAGLLFIRPWNNLQYVSSAAFLLTIYSDVLGALGQPLRCGQSDAGAGEAAAEAGDVLAFAKTQADYILGTNPMRTSYLVGYGAAYPRRVHHRAASSASYRHDSDFIGCLQGFDSWYSARRENPHDLVGAVVGGPNAEDVFNDHRGAYMQTEACTYNTAPMVGVFSKLMQLEGQQPRRPPSSATAAPEADLR